MTKLQDLYADRFGKPEWAWFAYALALLLPVRSPAASWITWGMLLGMLLPMVYGPFFRSKLARGLLVGAVVSVVCGYLTGLYAQQMPGRGFVSSFAVFQAGTLAGLVATAALGYWCVQRIGVGSFLVVWSAGLCVRAVAAQGGFELNPWKYGLALPVSLILLVVAKKFKYLGVFTAVILIVVMSIDASFRSWLLILGITMITAVFGSISAIRRNNPFKVSNVALILGLGIAAASSSLLWLATSGLLGDSVARRTNAQIESGGSIILGGRPEWGGAWALFRHDPLGFGLGTSPSTSDTVRAIRNMPFASAELQNLSTVASYFRAGTVSFHSVLWNFWGNYGIAGVLLIAFVFASIGYSLVLIAAGRARHEHIIATAMLSVAAMWDILFSPSLYQILGIAFAVAVHIILSSRVVDSTRLGLASNGIRRKEINDE
ncbi:hypothetical protein ACN9MI_21180 [Rhodococcoides fascians]|uniref:hypothetical protein n=1 Tax=Rhodococcoides fascians TaxID=1828 RepID=UPI003CEEF0EC